MDIESFVARVCWRVFVTTVLTICFRMGGFSWWNVVGIALGHFFLTGQLDKIYALVLAQRTQDS